MEKSATIRPYVEDDWPAVRDIVAAVWHHGVDCAREQRYGFLVGGEPWQDRKTRTLRDEIVHEREHWFVSELDGTVIGFCSFHLDPSTGIGQVGHNGVHPTHQGAGHGARQLRFVISKMKEAGMEIVEVQAVLNEGHQPARRMYEREGFRRLMDSRLHYLDLREPEP